MCKLQDVINYTTVTKPYKCRDDLWSSIVTYCTIVAIPHKMSGGHWPPGFFYVILEKAPIVPHIYFAYRSLSNAGGNSALFGRFALFCTPLIKTVL